jgi:hypothetical protein
MDDADLALAVPAVFFGAVGTAGQRCTSTRRLYLHSRIADEFLARLQRAYSGLRPGDPLDGATLLGPVHTRGAVDAHARAISLVQEGGGEVLAGGTSYGKDMLSAPLSGGNWCTPTIARPGTLDHANAVWAEETFAPVLNVATFEELPEAIAWNNAVRQGLSSSLWTRDIRHIGTWMGPAGSDCGIVNVRSRSCDGGAVMLSACRLTSARAAQRLARRSAGTKPRAGAVRAAAMRGDSMSAGALARSTSRTRHLWRRVYRSPYSVYHAWPLACGMVYKHKQYINLHL